MKEYEKIIEDILSKAEEDLSYLDQKEYREFCNYLWEVIKTENAEKLSAINNLLGDELYSKILEYIKNKHKDYYAFKYLRNNEIALEARIALLKKIYEDAIIFIDYPHLKKIIHKKLTEIDLDEIISVLQSITTFCIIYNRKGEHLAEILENMYAIEHDITNVLVELFNTNRLSLKLDYIIHAIIDKDGD